MERDGAGECSAIGGRRRPRSEGMRRDERRPLEAAPGSVTRAGRRVVPGTKESRKAIKTENRRQRRRAGGRGEAVVGSTEMAAVYQASRDGVQACIGRSLELWARRRTNGSRSKQKRKIWREGASSAAAGGGKVGVDGRALLRGQYARGTRTWREVDGAECRWVLALEHGRP